MAKEIIFKPLHGQTELDFVDAGMALKAGERRTVTEDEYAELITSPHIVDAKLGYNPNFVCADCKQPTYDNGYHDHARKEFVHLHDGKKRRCVACYEKNRFEAEQIEAEAVAPAEAPAKKAKEA